MPGPRPRRPAAWAARLADLESQARANRCRSGCRRCFSNCRAALDHGSWARSRGQADLLYCSADVLLFGAAAGGAAVRADRGWLTCGIRPGRWLRRRCALHRFYFRGCLRRVTGFRRRRGSWLHSRLGRDDGLRFRDARLGVRRARRLRLGLCCRDGGHVCRTARKAPPPAAVTHAAASNPSAMGFEIMVLILLNPTIS